MPRMDDNPLPSDLQELRRLSPGALVELRGTRLNPPRGGAMLRVRVKATPIVIVKPDPKLRISPTHRAIIGTLLGDGTEVSTFAIAEDSLFRVFREVDETLVASSKAAAEPAIAGE